MPTRTVRPLRRVVAGALVAVPLALGLVPYALAPHTGAELAFLIGATELGPVIGVAAVVLGLAAVAIVRSSRAARVILGAVPLLTLALTLYPTWTADRAARAALAELGQRNDSPVRVARVLTGLPTAAGVVEARVTYAAIDGTLLDARVYRGAACRAGATPCAAVAVFYGGAWRNGDASQAQTLNRHIAELGYVVVALDYRHAPAYRFPAQLDDVRRGLALVRDSAAAWGADADRVVLWGRSSGAHLAMLGAWDTAATAVHVRGVIDFYGPFDLVRGYADLPSPDPFDVRAILRDFIGGPPSVASAAYRAASPSIYVRRGLPPALLVYGGRDHVVKAEFGRDAATALRAAGVRVVHVELPFAEHGFDMGPNGADGQAAFAVAIGFLQAVLGR